MSKKIYLLKQKKLRCPGRSSREIQFIELIKENLFLTMGKYDNALAIYVLDKKNEFQTIKKIGRNFSLRRSCNLKFNKT